MEKTFVILGGIFGFLGVALGAFGAHALKKSLPDDLLATFEIGVRYHLYHSVALIGVAWAASRWPGAWTTAAGWLFVAGVAVFSGSLYTLALSGQRWLGAITPLGGLALLAGWAALAWGAYRG